MIMLGGEMIRITNCSSGPVAEEQIRKYQLDTAFIGAAAIGTDGRLYDGYSPEARFKSSLFPWQSAYICWLIPQNLIHMT